MKYKYHQSDHVLLSDIHKGDVCRYGIIIDSCVVETKSAMRGIQLVQFTSPTPRYWIKLLSGPRPVVIDEKEIIRKISKEEYDLVKVMLS